MSWVGRNGRLTREREPTQWEEWCYTHNNSDTCFRNKKNKENNMSNWENIKEVQGRVRIVKNNGGGTKSILGDYFKVNFDPLGDFVIKDDANENQAGTKAIFHENGFANIPVKYFEGSDPNGVTGLLVLKKGTLRQSTNPKYTYDGSNSRDYWWNTTDFRTETQESSTQVFDDLIADTNDQPGTKKIELEYDPNNWDLADERNLRLRLKHELNPFDPQYNRQASILWQVAVKNIRGDSKDNLHTLVHFELTFAEFRRICGYEFAQADLFRTDKPQDIEEIMKSINPKETK